MRKGLLVYPRFQLKVIGVLVLSVSLMAGFSIYLLKTIVAKAKQDLPLSVIDPLDLLMAKYLNILLITSFILMVVGGVLILVYTHRMVGPIYGLRKFLKKVQSGEPIDKLQFRRKDYFKDLPELINSVLKK